MSKRSTATIAVCLSLAIFLGACSGTSSPPASKSATPSTSASANTSASASTTPSQTPTQKEPVEQVFTFALINDPDGLDPGITSNSYAAPMLQNMFEGLMRYDVDNNLVYGIAESHTVSSDGLVYTFKLRDGLKWSNGMPLTTEDFIYAYLRVLDPAVGSNGPNAIYDYVKNALEVYKGELPKEELGVKAIDDRTLEFTLKNPCGFFMQLLTGWRFFPVCKAVVEKNPENWTRSAETYVSNGPFKYQDYQLSNYFLLERNENYWDAGSIKLDKIDFKFIPELATSLSAYEKGELDGVTRVPPSEVPRLKARDDFYAVPQFSHTYFLINTTTPALQDPKVRWALALAIDRTAMIEDVLQAPYEPARAQVPFGYVVDGVDFREDGRFYGISERADIERAKELLAEAGYPNGEGFPRLRLGYFTNETQKKVCEALQEMWRNNLNIEFEIVSAEWAVYFEQTKVLDYDICSMGNNGGFLHPLTFFNAFTGEYPQLETGWRNEEFNRLYQEALAETDPDKAWQKLHELEDVFMEEMPVLPIYYQQMLMMFGDHVKNWNFSPLAYYIFDKIYIEK